MSGEAAWAYHNHTKHTYESVRSSPQGLDWPNQPIPYKIYTDFEPIPLPEPLAPDTPGALDAIADVAQALLPVPLDVPTIASVLHYSAGITKTLKFPGGEMPFRAASCTGALYHIDLYLVCGDLTGLEAGVYHFGVHDHALRRLRGGDYRGVLVQATAGESAVAAAPGILVAASTYWRNAWKYRERAYRHCYWDCGTILANLLAITTALNLPTRLTLGFADQTVNALLGLDAQREVALAVIALGSSNVAQAPPPAITPLSLATTPLSPREIDYPVIREMHAASSLADADAVRSWRAGGTPERVEGRGAVPLQPFTALPDDGVPAVIRRRGSSRRFAHAPISFDRLSTMLERSTGPIPAGLMGGLNDLYLIVNAVEGLDPGAYVYHRAGEETSPLRVGAGSPGPGRGSLELLKPGDFRREAGHLGLDQALPADASVNVYYMADLGPLFERRGDRGYRAAQLEAGIMGGRLYLAAYALRLGATGLTFYDDEVTQFFSPHAAGKSPMFLMALGVPAQR